MSNKYVNDFTTTTKKYISSLATKEYEPIPKEIEDELFRRYKSGDRRAYKQLVNVHLRLVVNIAKKYKGMNVDMNDLISEGNLGLITAIERFDTEKGVRLCSYAKWWIAKYILESLGTKNKQEENELRFTDIKTEHDDDSNEDYADDTNILTDIESEDCNVMHYQEIVDSLLNTLDDRSKFVMERYYGLNNTEQLSISEIGEKLGISTERVRQIKNRAMMTLRSYALIQNVSRT